MERQEKPLKTEKGLARSTTIDAVMRPTEGVRCQTLLITSPGFQTYIPITAFAVAGSKRTSVNRNMFPSLDLRCDTFNIIISSI